MTTLNRTALTSPQKVDFAINALASQANHGAVTELSETSGISRPTIYDTRDTARELIENHFGNVGKNGTVVHVNEALLKRAIIALRVMSPNSFRAIEREH